MTINIKITIAFRRFFAKSIFDSIGVFFDERRAWTVLNGIKKVPSKGKCNY